MSVIIPTLNEAERLPTLLQSLGEDARKLLHLEVIVSDGGSTDGTVTAAERLADRVVIHRGRERQTIAEGRNAGAAVARGQVLVFVNADVQLAEDLHAFLERMVEAAEVHGAATCRVEVHPSQSILRDRIILGACNAAYYAWNRVGLGMGRGECHVVRRDVFFAAGGYDASLVAGEDFDLYRRIAAAGRGNGGARIAFLWDEVIWEDPRRYRKHGYARTLASWLRNSIYVTLFGRAYSEKWEPVR